MNFTNVWDELVNAVCRPPRDEYIMAEMVGGVRGTFNMKGRSYVREDISLDNQHGERLECSHYRRREFHQPSNGEKPAKASSSVNEENPLSIVIYCHCNSGSRRDAEEALSCLLPAGITVFCFDFAGSGRSEGQYVTLGANEVGDLEVVVHYLRQRFPKAMIGLWGRSMGAVTALLFSHKDPSIAGVVVDSPFARLTDLMLELVEEQRLPIPKFFLKTALGLMRRSVRRRAGFDLAFVSPIDIVSASFVPALFGHALEDSFINKRHSTLLYDAYAGDKNLILFDGDHNAIRPPFFYASVVIFFHNVLRLKDPFDGMSVSPLELDLLTTYSSGASPVPLPLLPQCWMRGGPATSAKLTTGNRPQAGSSGPLPLPGIRDTACLAHSLSFPRASSPLPVPARPRLEKQPDSAPGAQAGGLAFRASETPRTGRQAIVACPAPLLDGSLAGGKDAHWAGSPGVYATPSSQRTGSQPTTPASYRFGSQPNTPHRAGSWSHSPASCTPGSQAHTPGSDRYFDATSIAGTPQKARDRESPQMSQRPEARATPRAEERTADVGAAGRYGRMAGAAQALSREEGRGDSEEEGLPWSPGGRRPRDTLAILRSIIPAEFRALPLEEAEKRMLEEAISASLREDAEDAAAAAWAGTPPEELSSSDGKPVPTRTGSPGLAPAVMKRWAAGLRKGNLAFREFLSGTPRDPAPGPNGSTPQETRRRGFASTWRPLMTRKSPQPVSQPVSQPVQPNTLQQANAPPPQPMVLRTKQSGSTAAAASRGAPSAAVRGTPQHAGLPSRPEGTTTPSTSSPPANPARRPPGPARVTPEGTTKFTAPPRINTTFAPQPRPLGNASAERDAAGREPPNTAVPRGGTARPLNLAEAVTQRAHLRYSDTVMESSDTPRGPLPPSVLLDSAPFVPQDGAGARAFRRRSCLGEDSSPFDIVGILDSSATPPLSRGISCNNLEGEAPGTASSRETNALAFDRGEDKRGRFAQCRASLPELGRWQGSATSSAERPTSASSCESLPCAPGAPDGTPEGTATLSLGPPPATGVPELGLCPPSQRERKQALQFVDVAVKPRQQYVDAVVHSGASSGRTSTLGDLSACQGGEEKLWDLLATDTLVPWGRPYQDYSSKAAGGAQRGFVPGGSAEQGTRGTGGARGLQQGFWDEATSSGSRLLLQSSPADIQADSRHTSSAEQVERVLRLAAARLSNSDVSVELQRIDSSGGSGAHGAGTLVDELVETWHHLGTQCNNGRDTRDLLHRIGAAVDSELSTSVLGGSPMKAPMGLAPQKGLLGGVWDSASACDVRQRDPGSAHLSGTSSPGVVRPSGISVKERLALFERRPWR